MEDEGEIAARFSRFFQEVRCAPRYGICQSHDEFLKQADEYGTPLCDADFLQYLREMNFAERRAFNMAMGYVFDKISEYDIRLPKSEYLLVKASAAPLGNFYKEHREDNGWLSIRRENCSPTSVCLDRASSTYAPALFDGGWYEAELLPPVARWMGERARIRFTAASLSQLRLDLTTHIPDLRERPLGLEFFLRGKKVLAVSLIRPGWLEIAIDILDQLKPCGADEDALYEFEIRADRTWQPRPLDEQNRDDRELSIAVCNIEIFP
jgi:hypothetical protein